MLFTTRKTSPVAAENALPGRSTAIPTAENHFVNGHPIKGPYPAGAETIIFALGWIGGEAARIADGRDPNTGNAPELAFRAPIATQSKNDGFRAGGIRTLQRVTIDEMTLRSGNGR